MFDSMTSTFKPVTNFFIYIYLFMVGMATRANNNRINGAGIGWWRKHKKSVVTVLRKWSMNGGRSYTGATGKNYKIVHKNLRPGSS